jgi:hypothetical protein
MPYFGGFYQMGNLYFIYWRSVTEETQRKTLFSFLFFLNLRQGARPLTV